MLRKNKKREHEMWRNFMFNSNDVANTHYMVVDGAWYTPPGSPILPNSSPMLTRSGVGESNNETTASVRELVQYLSNPARGDADAHFNDDVECGICFDGCSDEGLETPCNHRYHVDCLIQWVKQIKTTCPMCRMSLIPLLGEGLEGVCPSHV